MARTAAWTAAALATLAAAAPPAPAADQGAPVVTITSQPAPGSLEARVSKMERVVEGQALADLLERIQRLQQDVQRLRGDLEVQANEIEGIKQRQRGLYLDVDRRLRQLETAASAPPPAAAPAPAVPNLPSFNPPGTTAPVPNPAQEQAAYQKAFELLKAGRYDDAIAAFRDMLATYPNGSLADNAQYWMGEANFAERRFQDAKDEFSKVINNYPQSPKVPDAMLKLGYSYYELTDWTNARQTLEQLSSRYPQSTAAQLAERRLEKMKSEGH